VQFDIRQPIDLVAVEAGAAGGPHIADISRRPGQGQAGGNGLAAMANGHRPGGRYKWVALSNTTLGALLASINASIMLIALPDVFRGIGVNPLQPGNPVRTLLGPLPGHLHPAQAAFLTSRGFFPTLISPAFAQGLSAAFGFAAVACLTAALASLLRGGRYVYSKSAGLAGPPGEGNAADSASPASRR